MCILHQWELYQIYKPSSKTDVSGSEADIFWYGFGQSFIQALNLAKESLGKQWRDSFEELVSAYHKKIAKDRADDEGLVVNPDGITDKPGEGDVTYPSEIAKTLIPYGVVTEDYNYYEVRNYVNDVNRQYSQVLYAYDENGKERESYTYGNERLDYSNGTDTWYYSYTGTGSVAQLTNNAGSLVTTYSYNASGNATVTGAVDTGNPYTYNGEYTDASTGSQYLRARYYDASTGSFFTEDSYLGSLLEPLERNLYTYAENNAVNYSDPSGHSILSKIKSVAKSAKKLVNKAASAVKNVAKKAVSKVKDVINKVSNTSISEVKEKAKETVSKAKKQLSNMSGTGGGGSGGKNLTAKEKAQYFAGSVFSFASKAKKVANNVSKLAQKASEKTIKHFCTTANRIKKTTVEFVKNVDWKKVAIGAGTAVGIAAVMGVATFLTGGVALPVIVGALQGAAIGAGSGAVISGVITAATGGSVADVARAASSGFMWGAIGGAATGGVTSFVKSAAETGSKAFTNAVLRKGVDVVTDTVVDTAQDTIDNGRFSVKSLAASLAMNTILGGSGSSGTNASVKNAIQDSAGEGVEKSVSHQVKDNINDATQAGVSKNALGNGEKSGNLLPFDLQFFASKKGKGNSSGSLAYQGGKTTNLTTGLGYDAGDIPVRIEGEWSLNDMKQALLGHPPKGLGSPDIHHGGQMPGAAKHEIIPGNHRTNAALHPNKYNQGVTPEMRVSDKELHWWYRAREQGADQLLPNWIYDN